LRNAMELVAHRPPVLLLDTFVDSTEDAVTAAVRVDPGAWYANEAGDMPAWFGLELMAQTVAVYSGVQQATKGLEPHTGYLLGTRSYVSSLPAFPAWTELMIHAKLHYLDESGLSAFHCAILLNGATIATALLKTLEVR
jgi:predicted hotdog family 3-hydroxylacyl-ACP dehydratase